MKNATIESMQSFCDVKTDKCGRQGHGKEHNSEDLPSGNRNKILGRNALLFKNKFKKVWNNKKKTIKQEIEMKW